MGVAVPEAGGEFSESALYSKIVVRRCGEISSDADAGVDVGALLDLLSVSVMTDRGLCFALSKLALALRDSRSELREGWYSSVGVGAMLFGVSGKSLSINLVADTTWVCKLGLLDWLADVSVSEEKPDVCSKAIVLPLTLRGRGATGCAGDFVCFCAPDLAELPELPRR